MVHTAILGTILCCLIAAIVIASATLNRALGKIQKGLKRAIQVTEDQQKTYTEIESCLRILTIALNPLKGYFEQDADERKLQLEATKELSAQTKDLKEHTTSLIRVAKAQVGATLSIEGAARMFTKQSFGLTNGAPAFEFDEENAIREMMQAEHVTRKEAEVAIMERRADDNYANFNVDR
jgi:hypothetical protein